MSRVVYIIANHDTGQAYAGLTKIFARRLADHRRRKPHLFAGNHTVSVTKPMSDKAAQRFEARSIHFLQCVGFRTVNEAKPGSLGAPDALIWTKEHCAAEASKYRTRRDCKRTNISAYMAACRSGWLDDICAHMTRLRVSDGHWTKERCAEEAAKYATRIDFSNGSRKAYEATRANGWLDDVCGHMVRDVYWTKERCAAEAAKYTRRNEFSKGSKSAYSMAQRKGWLEDVCRHMPRRRA
ncbi:hypothetical protein [Ensifer aridi]|uniref:hypothetical protein n=1 Tax=Ensifer aridi TaxID=1708715 RepID=UPI0011250436|nr:hypothetical protein [Ensifer aridi]